MIVVSALTEDTESRKDFIMATLARKPRIAARIVHDASIMSGSPVVEGTRVLAMTIVAYVRAGHSDQEIFEDYPTLPVDGIRAVREWAAVELGEDWVEARDNPAAAE
jgi:uncharacterized protein (DUF433 family)